MARYITDKHGRKMKLKGTPIHNSFAAAKQRCNYKYGQQYRDYGGRGIEFEWDCFYDFYMDMKSTWFEGATLERIDNDGNYNYDNCIWATRDQQAWNTRKNIHTEKSVKLIRELYETGVYNQNELAEIFRDSQGNISNIITRRTWDTPTDKELLDEGIY